MKNPYIYIFIMAGVTYAARVLPLTVIRRKIQNKFIRSFLYYVPYVTLSVMTFPSILSVTSNPVSGLLALIAGIAAAYAGFNLFCVALSCSAIVILSEVIILLL